MAEVTNALDTQEAGNHYKVQKVQPIELSYYIGGTPAFCKLSKYIGRVKENQEEDLRKAYHCIKLEEQLQFFAKQNYTYQNYEFTNYWIERHTNNTNIRNALRAMTKFNYKEAKMWVKTEAKARGVNLEE